MCLRLLALKSSPRTLHIIAVGFDRKPATFQALRCRSRRVTPRERVYHEITGMGQKIDEELGQAAGHPCRMKFEIVLATEQMVRVSVLRVAKCEHVGRYRAFVILEKRRRPDLVLGW